ncbi:hypothetical protein ACLOJK_003342 [Asimina triloba]
MSCRTAEAMALASSANSPVFRPQVLPKFFSLLPACLLSPISHLGCFEKLLSFFHFFKLRRMNSFSRNCIGARMLGDETGVPWMFSHLNLIWVAVDFSHHCSFVNLFLMLEALLEDVKLKRLSIDIIDMLPYLALLAIPLKGVLLPQHVETLFLLGRGSKWKVLCEVQDPHGGRIMDQQGECDRNILNMRMDRLPLLKGQVVPLQRFPLDEGCPRLEVQDKCYEVKCDKLQVKAVQLGGDETLRMEELENMQGRWQRRNRLSWISWMWVMV